MRFSLGDSGKKNGAFVERFWICCDIDGWKVIFLASTVKCFVVQFPDTIFLIKKEMSAYLEDLITWVWPCFVFYHWKNETKHKMYIAKIPEKNNLFIVHIYFMYNSFVLFRSRKFSSNSTVFGLLRTDEKFRSCNAKQISKVVFLNMPFCLINLFVIWKMDLIV